MKFLLSPARRQELQPLATTDGALHPTHDVEVQIEVLQDSSATNVDQLAIIQPTTQTVVVVEQLSVLADEESMTQTSIIPSIDVVDIDLYVTIILEEAMAGLAKIAHSPNPKIIPASLILDEEV